MLLRTLNNPFWTKGAKANITPSISSSNLRQPRERQPWKINSPNISPDVWTCFSSRWEKKKKKTKKHLNSHVFLKHPNLPGCHSKHSGPNRSYWHNSYSRDEPASSPEFLGFRVASCPQNRLSGPRLTPHVPSTTRQAAIQGSQSRATPS